LPTSSAFLRAARTSSVSSPICLPTFFACLPDFLTCLATPVRPDPVPGIGTPRTFFGLWLSFVPRTTPPTTPAAAVTTPVTTAALELPFEPLFRAPLPPDDDELRLRDEAEDVRLLEALVLFGLLRELAERLLAEEERLLAGVLRLFVPEALRLFVPEALVLLGLDPFELREVVFLLLCDRELGWAISPP
jgi:hypothetical protein